MIAYGDKVRYVIERSRGEGYVIGTLAYGENVLMLSDDDFTGMPINKRWCEKLSSGHEDKCTTLRERYSKLYPKVLRPL